MTQENQGSNIMVQGRLVWLTGKTPFIGETKKDQQTKQVITGKDGNPVVEYGFGLAVPVPNPNAPGMTPELLARTTENFMTIWNAIQTEARKIYPSGQFPPGFAWKYKDGLTGSQSPLAIDQKGVPYSQRKGYEGCYVFACTTRIPINWFRNEQGQVNMTNEGIKCGDYVQVQLSVKSHSANGNFKPGMYLNPNMVLFLGFGEEIVNMPSGEQIFGSAMPVMPFGASATPIGVTAPVQFAPSPQGQPVGYPPPTVQQQAPQAAPQPYYGAMPAQFQQQAQPAFQQPQPQAVPQPAFAPPAAPAQTVQPPGVPGAFPFPGQQ